MRVSVFGLGYVGCVSVACLSKERHQVIGVDVIDSKVNAIANGLPTVVEPEVSELIAEGHAAGRISATSDVQQAVLDTDVSIICVGTPTGRDGSLDMTAIRAIANSMGDALNQKQGDHLVIVRSTVPPGTVQGIVRQSIMNRSGRSPGNVEVVLIPEFLREGTAVKDFYNPSLVVVGTCDGEISSWKGEISTLLAVEPSEVHWRPYGEAEMMKSLCNVFHAMKVTFGNEVGTLCEQLGIDGRRVMHLLTLDTKLNISPAYLRPGMPYGGSCLPKDLSATIALAKRNFVDLPLLKSIQDSNEEHLRRACDTASRLNGYRKVGMDGLSFKADTDDLRESPLVAIAEHLIGKGYDLRILDPCVDSARLSGANRDYIMQRIPHLAERLVSTREELLEHSEAILLTREDNDLLDHLQFLNASPAVIDLTGAGRTLEIADVGATKLVA